jgi:hypothetical protein
LALVTGVGMDWYTRLEQGRDITVLRSAHRYWKAWLMPYSSTQMSGHTSLF